MLWCVVAVASSSFLGLPALGQSTEPMQSAPPSAQRLLAVMDVAMRSSLLTRSNRARIDLELSAATADRALSSPSVSWHGEGFGSSLERELNGIDYYTFVQPFRMPGSGTRQLRQASNAWSEASRRAERVESASTGALLWLALATEVEARGVLEARVRRIDRALELYRLRLEVGEVAGSEVRQLELQRAQDLARLSGVRRELEGHRAALASMLGVEVAIPEAGDLERVARWLSERAQPSTAPLTQAEPPLFERVERDLELAEARGRVDERLAWGEPSVALDWEHVPSLGGMPSIDALGIELSIPLPIGRGFKARRASARAAVRNAEAAAALERRSLEQRVARALENEQEARALLAELAGLSERLPSIESSLLEQFRLGAVSYLVFLDGLSRLDDHRLQESRLRHDLLRYRLERAALLGDPSIFPFPRDAFREASAADERDTP